MIFASAEDWMTLVGRTHPLIVHLPIGILFIAVTLECLSYFNRFSGFRAALSLIWLFCAVTSIMACVAGLILSEEGGFDESVLQIHQWLGIAVAVLSTIIFAIKAFVSHRSITSTIPLSIVSLIVISFAGHYGGTLTHGEDYLTSALYAALDIDVEEETVKVPRKPIEKMEDANVYADLVEPVLEEKCIRCHGERKQKGRLRLDDYTHILKGGKSKSTLVAGKPMESELFKRLVLPEDDKKRMPPKGKKQLTKEEIALIEWWIQEGSGAADKRVGEVPQPEPIKAALAAFSHQEEFVDRTESEVPTVTVTEPSEEGLKALRDAGLVVNRFTPELPFLTVNCVNAQNFSDDQTKLLLPLKDQIIWLNAGHTKITDAGLENIGKLHHLTRLSLNNNTITDRSISHLGQLSELRYLNLVGTGVSMTGLASINSCRNLRALYLWQTKVTKSDVSRLQQLWPQATINLGE